ncbi:hypothetical protein SRB17_87120 [Streptomyces sp. RB17]|uniref:transposase n=1 Tax=Streptomyces sp. RB17 TaxID=2585197 RepID=UPI001307B311|nr:transposase [Streptomyces sp. RB17]MQY40679.1 hypothetical protein [Streptomyces sp. RB17]
MSPRWNPHPGVRTGRHVVHNLHVHLAFVTKYRRKAFTDEMLTRHEKTTREVCADFEADLKQFNGDADHLSVSQSTSQTSGRCHDQFSLSEQF